MFDMCWRFRDVLSFDYFDGVFENNSSVPVLFLSSLLGPHSQQGSNLPPESPQEAGLLSGIWNVPGTTQQPQLEHSTYNPLQPPTVPDTGDIATRLEVAPRSQRRQQDPERSSGGQNPYGRNGTLKCGPCRHWRRKVYSTVLWPKLTSVQIQCWNPRASVYSVQNPQPSVYESLGTRETAASNIWTLYAANIISLQSVDTIAWSSIVNFGSFSIYSSIPAALGCATQWSTSVSKSAYVPVDSSV